MFFAQLHHSSPILHPMSNSLKIFPVFKRKTVAKKRAQLRPLVDTENKGLPCGVYGKLPWDVYIKEDFKIASEIREVVWSSLLSK